MASTGTGGGEMSVLIHPLVIVNMSDHWTRAQIQGKSRIYGALYGEQDGRRMEIHTSFELALNEDDSIDFEYLTAKAEKYQEVFKTYEVLGWYSTGKSIEACDPVIQRDMLAINETAIFLLLDTQNTENPLSVYESLSVSEDEHDLPVFSSISYSLEVIESERIALDHVTRYARGGQVADVSSAIPHLFSLHNSISLLQRRLEELLQYLELYDSGHISMPHGLLRRIASIWYRIPHASQSPSIVSQGLASMYADASILTYLTSLSKAVRELEQFASSHVQEEEYSSLSSRFLRRSVPTLGFL